MRPQSLNKMGNDSVNDEPATPAGNFKRSRNDPLQLISETNRDFMTPSCDENLQSKGYMFFNHTVYQ